MNVEITEDPPGIFESLFGTPVGSTIPNCHTFAGEPDPEGNNGFETVFPETIGSWTRNYVGARTGYSMITSDARVLQLV